MANIRVINIGDQLLISVNNKDVDFYSKDKSYWFAESGIIKLSYDDKVVVSGTPEEFVEPSEKSVVDLIIMLNNMLLSKGSILEKLITSDYTLTNEDANYMLVVDLSSNDIDIKMPISAQAGLQWQIKDNGNAGTYICTINGNGKNVEGMATAPDIISTYEARLLYLSELNNEYLLL